MSQQNKIPASFYKNFSTETLESMLRDMTLSENELDLEQLDAIMAELDRREGPTETMTPEDALNIFRENYAGEESAFMECAQRLDTTELPRRKSRRWLKRVLILVAAICLLFGMASVVYASIPDSPFVQWVDEVFSFDGISPGEYHSLQEALDAYDIEETLLPCWLPRRYTISEINVTETEDSLILSGSYNNMDNTDNLLTISIKQLPSQAKIIYEKDAAPVEAYEVSGTTYYVTHNTERSSILWENGAYQCSITGSLSDTEIERIIYSIREYSTLQSALDAYGVEEKLVPDFLPEQYALMQVLVNETEIFTSFAALYENF